MRLSRRCVFVLLLIVFASVASAQVGSSTITGRVTDATGAVVPRVNVAIIQTDTNFKFAAVTNEDGLYRVPSLSPGSYRITFEASGFKRVVRDGVDLRAGDVLALDAVLQVGNVTESVEV